MKTSTLEEQFASSWQLSQLIFQDTVKSLKLVLQVTLLPNAQRLHCTYARAPPEVAAPERMLRCLYDFGYKSHNLLRVAPIHISASSG